MIVGVTATPERNDKLGLLDVFQKITYSISIATMIKNGHLSPVVGRKILTDISLIGVKIHDGDFVSGSLSKAVNTPERNNFIVNKFKMHAINRKAIAFCADVKHCKDLAVACIKHGIKAAAVWGDMPSEDRQKALADFKNGELQVLTSCGVLTEGYDEESISCIIMARPTKSRSLYIQCVGRGLRKPNNPLSKKTDCLVLDFTDNHHTISTIMTLKATIPTSIELGDEEKPSFVINEKSEPLNARTKITEISDNEFDILNGKKIKMLWTPIGDNEYSLMDDNNRYEIIIHPQNDGYVASVYKDNVLLRRITQQVPLNECIRQCEKFTHANMNVVFANLKGKWIQTARKQKPTFGQIQILQNNKIKHHQMNRADASIKIRRIIAIQKKQQRFNKVEPATERQKSFLQNAGINPEHLSKAQAMAAIAMIKQGDVYL